MSAAAAEAAVQLEEEGVHVDIRAEMLSSLQL